MDRRKKISLDYDKKIKNTLIQVYLYFGLFYSSEKKGKKSDRTYTLAKSLACYFLKRFTFLSSSQIGDYIGLHEPSSILYHDKKIKALLLTDKEIIKYVTDLTPIVELHFKNKKTITKEVTEDLNSITVNLEKLNNIELRELKRLFHKFNKNSGYTDIQFDPIISKIDRTINY